MGVPDLTVLEWFPLLWNAKKCFFGGLSDNDWKGWQIFLHSAAGTPKRQEDNACLPALRRIGINNSDHGFLFGHIQRDRPLAQVISRQGFFMDF